MLTRRSFLASASALSAGALFAPAVLRAQEPLVLWGPTATPSVLLAQVAASGELDAVAPGVTFNAWRTPDELRAGISSGSILASVVPSYVAANFYNRGLGVRLANIQTYGLQSIVSTDPDLTDIAGLEGKTIGVPFRNDMPDYVLQRLLDNAGLTPGEDVTIEYAATPAEAVQLLLSGRADTVLINEPAATAALARAAEAGQDLRRAVDITQAWAAISGKPLIPQAGLAITDRLVERIGEDGVEALQVAIENALETVLADPDSAAQLVAEAFGQPAPIIARAIPNSNLVATRASEIKQEIADFYDVLAGANPDIIGGRQPDDDFYAL
jgi:NitT/TauT family transport system substrate-binding protein